MSDVVLYCTQLALTFFLWQAFSDSEQVSPV